MVRTAKVACEVESVAELEPEDRARRKRREDFFAGYWKQYIEKKLREFKLTDFEKEKYLEYIYLKVKYRAVSLGGSSGCVMVKALEKFYGADVSDILPEGQYEFDDDFIYQEVCQKLETIIEKIKLPPYKDDLKNKIDWLCSVFELSKPEKEYITLIYLVANNECIKDFLDFYSNRRCYSYFNELYGWQYGDGETVENNLLKKGIFIDTSATTVGLNPYYEKLLKDKTLTTKLKFEKYLTGKVQKTELTLKDFDYITQVPLIVKILKNAVKQKKKGVNILLTGACGSGKTELVKRLSMEAGLNCYAVATDNEEKEITRAERLADLNTKQAVLSRMENTCLLFDEAEDVFNRGFGENGTASKGYLNRLLENNKVPVMYTTNNFWDMDSAFLRRFNYILETPSLNKEKRFNLWSRITKKNKLKVSKAKLEELSELYDVQPSIIANAVETTKLIEGDDNAFGDIVESVAAKVSKKNEIKEEKTFDDADYDLSLCNTDVDLHNLTEKIKACGKINFSMCLYGESGTGKSQYGKKLANELGLEVVYKRVSDIIDCWVGSSERNLSDAFQECKEKKAMLILDEADSFMQNRSNAVRSFEVQLVNQFLTELESATFPVICTTNLKDSLEPAVLRRFTFKVKFHYMKPEQVKKALKHFFNLDSDIYIKGLTPGDCANVRKQTSFLEITDETEIIQMLKDEVKGKLDKELQNTVGF